MYMKCSVVATKITDIIDHEASFLTRMRFYGHLLMCAKCNQYFKQFKLLKIAANKDDPDQLPSDFDQVMDFVMSEINTHENNETESN